LPEFNIKQVNKFILSKQHLTNDSKIDNIIQISNDLCGLHATGTIEPYLSLFVRMNNFKKDDLDRELYINRSMGRIRGMRKTLFIEPKEMIPIVHNSIRYTTIQRDLKYLKYRGISKAEYGKLSKQILALLHKDELSTSELKKILHSEKDIVAVISVMCDEMLLIRGKPLKSWKDRRIYYAPFKNYFPNLNLEEIDETVAIETLIGKYIKTYGPVTVEDIVWWLGITKGKVNGALLNLEDKTEIIKIKNLEYDYIINKTDLDILSKIKQDSFQSVNVLPDLDPYMMGYKNRERYVDYKNYEYIYDRSGNATTSILLNGVVIGIWDIVEKPNPQIKVFLFDEVENQIKSQIGVECKNIGNFIIEKDISIKFCKKMTPLTKRTMGGFMSPLKEC
jgi:hypothetical protein